MRSYELVLIPTREDFQGNNSLHRLFSVSAPHSKPFPAYTAHAALYKMLDHASAIDKNVEELIKFKSDRLPKDVTLIIIGYADFGSHKRVHEFVKHKNKFGATPYALSLKRAVTSGEHDFSDQRFQTDGHKSSWPLSYYRYAIEKLLDLDVNPGELCEYRESEDERLHDHLRFSDPISLLDNYYRTRYKWQNQFAKDLCKSILCHERSPRADALFKKVTDDCVIL